MTFTAETHASTSLPRRRFLIGGSALAASGLALLPSRLPAADDGKLRLLARVDDLGCCRSLNRAVKQCLTEGVARNASVLAPTPHVEEAAEMLAGLDNACFGLHTTLTSEWNNVRWGPVAPRDKVRSLLDDDGMLHQYLPALKQVDAEEALIEFTAQLERARKLGFDIRYADSHMGAINHPPGLANRFAAWCRSNRLIDYRAYSPGRLEGLPNYWSRPGHRKDSGYPRALLASLKGADRQQSYLVVSHPAFDDEETRALGGHDGYPADAVASNLNLERLALVDPEIVAFCTSDAVKLLRYDDLKPADRSSD